MKRNLQHRVDDISRAAVKFTRLELIRIALRAYEKCLSQDSLKQHTLQSLNIHELKILIYKVPMCDDKLYSRDDYFN